MEEIVKHINDTNASFRTIGAGDAKNTDLFLDNEHYELFRDAGEQITVRYNKENLQKAILFIASILPRKYDNSAIHRTEQFNITFVFEQLAFLDAFFTVDGVRMESRTQVWNSRKDIMKKNGEIDNRFYFNGLLEEVAYTNHKGESKVAKFTIRNYLAGGYSDLHIKKAENGIFDVWITNTFEHKDDGKEKKFEEIETVSSESLQQIFYGAPGTGKSHTIQRDTEGEDVIRTTFHPDTDYSTFVGCYKPSSIELPIRDVTGKVIVENGKVVTENRIVYEFVSQAFLQAYVEAWKKMANPAEEGERKQFLVIEEINRGNCAQIFGDLFQLLDRNPMGYSEYPIKADADMKKQLKRLLAGLEIENAGEINELYKGRDVVGEVLDGDILLLPNNLYIWATMNTSDQSLFPIDSAFKRRWDWKYIPISDSGEKWMIETASKRYDWWQFLEKINNVIGTTTNSEDKKLGYFFCKAKDGKIDAETFVGKVVFYLWNDVFKDFIEEADTIFKDDKGETLSFNRFYQTEGRDVMVVDDTVDQFLKNLGVEATEFDEAEESNEAESEITLEGEVADEVAKTQRKETLVSIQIPDNPIILSSDSTQFDAFVKALRIIGIDRVSSILSSLKYKRLNCPVLSNEMYDAINNDKGYSYHQEGSLYIVKGCKNYTYIRILEDLDKLLNIGLSLDTK